MPTASSIWQHGIRIWISSFLDRRRSIDSHPLRYGRTASIRADNFYPLKLIEILVWQSVELQKKGGGWTVTCDQFASILYRICHASRQRGLIEIQQRMGVIRILDSEIISVISTSSSVVWIRLYMNITSPTHTGVLTIIVSCICISLRPFRPSHWCFMRNCIHWGE